MAPRGLSPKRDSGGDAGGNPLRTDPELSGLLKRLDKVKKYKTFDRWKTKFLGRLTSLVYEKGMDPAEKTCTDFSKVLKTTVKCASKVTGHIEKGELTTEKKTVKASLALSELGNNLTTSVQKLEDLIPSTGRDEKKRGYTKYHLGAVLIRQGFHQYITMKQIEDALGEIAARVGDVADKQLLELFEFYKVKFKKFCDIMADLGLYEIMKKCAEFAEAPEEEESSDEEPMGVEISVETPEGTKKIILEVEPSDTVESVKKLIEDDIGIPPEKQVIKLKGKELDDKSTLGQAGVADGAKLTAEPKKIPVTVKTHDGKEIKLMVDPENYLSDVKRMIEPESGVPAAKQKLFMNDTMKELTDDNKNIDDCGIKPGTVLYMEPTSMTINVEMPDGKKHEVDVSPSDTAEEVKAKIADQTGMPAPQQVLKFNGKELPKGKKLKDIGIKDGDTVKVESLKVPVTVKTKDGKEIKIMVDPMDTVAAVKKQLEDETGLPVDQQVLAMNNGKELDDNKKTAADLGIKAGSVLTLAPKCIKITIELPDGTNHNLEIDATDKSADMKGKISKTGLSSFLVASTGKLELDTSKVFGK